MMTEDKVEFNNRWIKAVKLDHNFSNEYTEVLILSGVNEVQLLAPVHHAFTCLIRSVSLPNHAVFDAVILPRRVLELWGVLPKMSDVE